MPSPEESVQLKPVSSQSSVSMPKAQIDELQRANSTSLNPLDSFGAFIGKAIDQIPNQDLENIARAMMASHRHWSAEARELLGETFSNPAVLGGMAIMGAALAFPPTTGPATLALGALGVATIGNQALKASQLAMEGKHEEASKEFAEMFVGLATTLGPTAIGKLGGLAKIGSKVPGLKNILNAGRGSKGTVEVQLPNGKWQQVGKAQEVSSALTKRTPQIGQTLAKAATNVPKVAPVALANEEFLANPSENTDQSNSPTDATPDSDASNSPSSAPSNPTTPASPSTTSSLDTNANRQILQSLSNNLIKARSGERASYIGMQNLKTDEASNKWVKAALNEWLASQGKTSNLLDINDGSLTPETISALKQFQKANTFNYEENGKEVSKALAADGVVGPRTMQALQRFLESRSVTYSENGTMTAKELTGALAKEKGQTTNSSTTSTQTPETNTAATTQEFASKTASVFKSAIESTETSTLLAEAQIRTGQGAQPLASSLAPEELTKHVTSSDSTKHNLIITLKEEPDTSAADWQKLLQMFEEAGIKVNKDGKELTVSL